MSRDWSKGSTTAWRAVRARVLLANASTNAGRCVLNVGLECQKHGHPCLGVCTGVATQAHHARGKAHGDDERYLVPACRACNLHVGSVGAIVPEPKPVSKW